MNQPPLNPDGVLNAMDTLMAETDADERATEWARKVTTRVLEGYFAAALPEVTSVEELDQLPMRTYVQGADGFKHAKDSNGGWHLIVNRLSSAPHLSGSIELPARVLYRPSEQP